MEGRRGEIQHCRHTVIGQEGIERRGDDRAWQSQSCQVVRQELSACRVRIIDRNGRGATRQWLQTRAIRPQGDVATADDSQSDPGMRHVFPPLPRPRCPGTIAWREGGRLRLKGVPVATLPQGVKEVKEDDEGNARARRSIPPERSGTP